MGWVGGGLAAVARAGGGASYRRVLPPRPSHSWLLNSYLSSESIKSDPT